MMPYFTSYPCFLFALVLDGSGDVVSDLLLQGLRHLKSPDDARHLQVGNSTRASSVHRRVSRQGLNGRNARIREP